MLKKLLNIAIATSILCDFNQAIASPDLLEEINNPNTRLRLKKINSEPILNKEKAFIFKAPSVNNMLERAQLKDNTNKTIDLTDTDRNEDEWDEDNSSYLNEDKPNFKISMSEETLFTPFKNEEINLPNKTPVFIENNFHNSNEYAYEALKNRRMCMREDEDEDEDEIEEYNKSPNVISNERHVAEVVPAPTMHVAEVVPAPTMHVAEVIPAPTVHVAEVVPAPTVHGINNSILINDNEEQPLLSPIKLNNLVQDSSLNRSVQVKQQALIKAATIKVSDELIKTIYTILDSRIDSHTVAIAAGDGANSTGLKGLWISSIYNKGKQAKTITKNEYTSNTTGATIGFELELDENDMVGIAYTNVQSNINFNKEKPTNNIRSKSNLFTLYAQHQFDNNLFIRAMGLYGQNQITIINYTETTSKVYKASTGNFTNYNYSATAILGYRYQPNDLIFIPSVGISYSAFKDNAYTETGTAGHNLSFGKRLSSNLSMKTGLKSQLEIQVTEELQLVPSLNLSIEKSLVNKASKINAKLEPINGYSDNQINQGKDFNLAYNIGGTILTKHKNLEISAGYNLHLSRKYYNHGASLKLKICL